MINELLLVNINKYLLKQKTMEFKKRMTFNEMAQYLTENTSHIPNRVTVGKFAKKMGYKTYKPMIKRKVFFYYVKENVTNQ